MLEHAVKALELATRYSWAFAVALAFVLFIPDPAAAQLGLLPIRSLYLGYLWIGFVACCALWISGLGPYVKETVSSFFRKRAEESDKLKEADRRRCVMLARLRSLSPDEILWFQYCLYYGQQTLFGEAHQPLAFALVQKGMVGSGGGTVFKVSYTLTDTVWKLAQEITDELLPPEVRTMPDIERILERFRKSLYANNF
jgi:hypothetical protein